jgi:hypothetical protein
MLSINSVSPAPTGKFLFADDQRYVGESKGQVSYLMTTGTVLETGALLGSVVTIAPGEIDISGAAVTDETKCRVSPKHVVGKPTFSS